MNIFCPSFFPPIPLAGHSTMPGSSSPGAQGHHCLAKSPHPPVAWLKEPCSIPGTFSLLVTFFFFFGGGDFFLFCFAEICQSSPSTLSPPPSLERVKWEREGRKSHSLSKACKDDLCSHLWGMTVTVDLLSGLDYM